MKKRSFIHRHLLVAVSALLVTFSGCSEDFFTRQAGDRITPDQHYQTIIDGVISSYGAIIYLQEAMPRLVMLDGLRSDLMEVTPYASMDLKEINDHQISPDNPFANTADLYKVIVNINEVLVHLDEVAANDREFDDNIQYFVTGDLLSMRAWVYLTLVRLHGHAVYIEDNLPSLPENLEQNTVPGEVLIDTLINQLIPYVYDPTIGIERQEYGLGFYMNAKSMLGELYLEANDYANAVTYLKMACESFGNQLSVYKVDNTYKDDAWKNIFLNAESAGTENISVMPFNSVEGQNNLLVGWLGYDYDYFAKPSGVLIDSFMAQIPAAGDPGDLWRGLGTTFQVDTLTGESYITKYEIDQADPFSSDLIISRAADLHLMMAEAYNRMGDDVSQGYALMLLNQGVNKENPKPPEFARWRSNVGVRGRVYLTSHEVDFSTVTGADRTKMIEDFIIQERALEMAFEGKRWFDLMRVAKRRNDPAFLADKVAAKFEGTGRYDEIRNRLMNPDNWYLPSE